MSSEPHLQDRSTLIDAAVVTAAGLAHPHLLIEKGDTLKVLRMWDRHGLTKRETRIVGEAFGRLGRG